jgi:hypothetical protein
MGDAKSSAIDPRWRWLLGILGGLLVVAAGALEFATANFHTVTTVKTTGVTGNALVTTIASPGPPPLGLITTVLAIGFVSLVLSAFGNRISKVSVGGAEVDFDTGTTTNLAKKATAAAGGDPEKFQRLFARALAELKSGSVTPLGTRSITGAADVTQLEDDLLERALTQAADAEGIALPKR